MFNGSVLLFHVLGGEVLYFGGLSSQLPLLLWFSDLSYNSVAVGTVDYLGKEV